MWQSGSECKLNDSRSIKRLTFHDLRAYFCPDAEHWPAALHRHEMVRFHDAVLNAIDVERADAAHVDHLVSWQINRCVRYKKMCAIHCGTYVKIQGKQTNKSAKKMINAAMKFKLAGSLNIFFRGDLAETAKK